MMSDKRQWLQTSIIFVSRKGANLIIKFMMILEQFELQIHCRLKSTHYHKQIHETLSDFYAFEQMFEQMFKQLQLPLVV